MLSIFRQIQVTWLKQSRYKLSSGLAAIALLSTSCSAPTQPTLTQTQAAPAQPISADPALAQSIAHLPIDSALASQLADIAFGYAQAQAPDRAISLLQKAETYPGEECFEAIPWLKIGVAYQAAGELGKGETFLERAATSATEKTAGDCYLSATSPAESFHNRAVEYAESGYLDLGLQLAYRVDDFFQTMKLAEIAVAFAEAGRQDEAEKILNRAIAEQEQMFELYADTLPQEPPLTMANRIRVLIAMQVVDAQQPELAKLALDEVVESLQALPSVPKPSSEFDTSFGQNFLAVKLLAEIEQPQQARQLLDATVQSLDPPPADPSRWLEAATLYSQLGSQKSDELFSAFEASLPQLPATQKASVQTALVEGYAALGEFDKALAMLNAMDKKSGNRGAKWAIATEYAKAGLAEAAYAFVEANINQLSRTELMHFYLSERQYAEAEQIARQPDLLDFLPEVAYAYCEAGEPEQVMPLIEISPSKDYMRRCAAVAFAEKDSFSQALSLADAISSPETRISTLTDIATIQVQRKPADAEKAVETLDRALSLLIEETDGLSSK